MEQITVNKRDGRTIHLFSFRNGSGITKAEQIIELQGQDIINIAIESAAPIEFDIGDHIDVFGWRYNLNVLPTTKKDGERKYQYELKFEGVQYQLIKVQYLDIDVSGFSTGVNFSLMGNLRDFADMVIRNAERVYGYGAWELGECPDDTLTQNIDFNTETCLQVLQNLCELYDVHFYFEVADYGITRLHLTKSETTMDDVFRYGRGRGLYQLERQAVSSRNIITRLFAFGSERNLSASYRGGSTRLKLPLASIPSEGAPYIEDTEAIIKYGVVEASTTFDEIYPHRIGRVSNIDIDNINRFVDSSMTFDLNERDGSSTRYLIPGQTAKITFNTGNLAGYTFDINETGGYNHEVKRFTIVPYTDSRGMTFPNAESSAFRIGIGDEYVITDIMMPPIYITEAENILLEKAQDYLAKNSVPVVQYVLNIDAKYVEKKARAIGHNNYFNVGEYLQIQDTALSIDGKVQINAFTRDLLSHFKYSLTLGEEVVTRTGAMYQARKMADLTKRVDSISVRSSATTIRTTMVVDPRAEIGW